MCGITGFYSFNGNIDPGCIIKMTDSLRHRGPDDEGFLAGNSTSGRVINLTGSESKTDGTRIEEFSGPANLFLGHRRLSIIDLSPAGHQPLCNEDGLIWIVYNGEVYNYLEIREELKSLGHRLKSQTDTEVVLHAYEEWGTNCLKRFNGMWSFAIVDLNKNRIFCSRDRAGVKPFYYIYDGSRFAFASEIKALLQIEGFSAEPNEQIIADYLFSGHLDHTPETFFKNVYQLGPAEYLVIEDNQLTIKSYWDIEFKPVRFCKEEEYAERFYELLKDSIQLRLRSDVPIGSCLSGGLDSSSIVCLANRLMFETHAIDPRLVGEKQKTFSSCFENYVYDERKYIELVIRQTNAEKNYVFPSGESFAEDLSKLIWYQDEPFDSTSIYAQWDVMRLARERGVTVLLDGQGGDELLGGYLPSFYYLFVQRLKRGDLRGLVKEMNGFRNKHRNALTPVMSAIWIGIVSNGIKRAFRKTTGRTFQWAEKAFQKKYYRGFPRPSKFETDLDNYLYHIFRFLTLPRLLHSEDRNSMAFSLETRLPFLDFRLVEYIFSLPWEQKMREGVTKVVLRNAMQGTLPEEVRNRYDKMGFVTPEDLWLKTVLKNRIYEVIGSRSFGERGYFAVEEAKEAFDNHCSGKMNMGSLIWRWVNLEFWFRTFIDKTTPL